MSIKKLSICKFLEKVVLGNKKKKVSFTPNGKVKEWSQEEILLTGKVIEYRLSKGKSDLSVDSRLHQIARGRDIKKVTDTVKKTGKKVHYNFPEEVYSKVVKIGTDLKVGENIGYGWSDSPGGRYGWEKCFEAWVESKEHRKNMLNDKWTSTAVGITLNEAGEKEYCQIFVGK